MRSSRQPASPFLYQFYATRHVIMPITTMSCHALPCYPPLSFYPFKFSTNSFPHDVFFLHLVSYAVYILPYIRPFFLHTIFTSRRIFAVCFSFCRDFISLFFSTSSMYSYPFQHRFAMTFLHRYTSYTSLVSVNFTFSSLVPGSMSFCLSVSLLPSISSIVYK